MGWGWGTHVTFAVLQESSTSTRLSYQLTFPNCQLKQGDTPSYKFHPARVLLHEQDIPPIGSGKFEIKDKEQDRNYYVFNNIMKSIAVEFKGGAAIFAGYVANTTISQNTVSNTG